MDKNQIIGFAADYHHKKYKCANCGHTKTFSQLTNFYEHKIVEWEEKKVCPQCGFLSLKSMSLSEELGLIPESPKEK